MKKNELNGLNISPAFNSIAEAIGTGEAPEPKKETRGRPRTSPEGQPRRLFVLTPENALFLGEASKAMGLSYSAFINLLLESYKKSHADLCNNVKKDMKRMEQRKAEI